MAILTFKATGNILPSRFVTMSGEHAVNQADDNVDIIGVAHEGTKRAPLSDYGGTLYAAESGDEVAVYSVGEVCLVEAGGAISAGQLLKSNANGQAVPVATTGTTIQNYGAIALQNATAAGQKIQCLVTPLQKVRPALT